MASNYTGNSTAAQAPSPAPTLGSDGGGDPVGSMPADGDTLNVSSVLQALKVPLDWIAFFRRIIARFKGIATWDSSLTYAIGDIVLVTGGRTYISKTVNTNKAPGSNPSDWDAWAHTNANLVADLSALYGITTGAGGTYVTLPGGLTIMIKELAEASGDLPSVAGGTATFLWPAAFSTTCFGAVFQPRTLSVSHSLGMPSITITAVTASGATVALIDQGASANGYVATGYVIAFGV
jgi:hypothetical protein